MSSHKQIVTAYPGRSRECLKSMSKLGGAANVLLGNPAELPLPGVTGLVTLALSSLALPFCDRFVDPVVRMLSLDEEAVGMASSAEF